MNSRDHPAPSRIVFGAEIFLVFPPPSPCPERAWGSRLEGILTHPMLDPESVTPICHFERGPGPSREISGERLPARTFL